MAAESKLENIMTIDKVLHEKNLGLLWQTFQMKPSRQRTTHQPQSNDKPSQLQSIQSTINATKLQYLDRK